MRFSLKIKNTLSIFFVYWNISLLNAKFIKLSSKQQILHHAFKRNFDNL